jgi:hypothetical protein
MDTEDMAALNRKLETTDAMVWAEEFVRIITDPRNPGADPTDTGFMVTWFANAIMRGHDAGVVLGRTDGYQQAMSEAAAHRGG